MMSKNLHPPLAYFKDFELLAAGAPLREDADFWTSLPEFEAVLADWEAYKWAIFEGYPGSTSANWWTYQDLCQLSATQASQPITSLEEFLAFHRKISAMGS